jgi:hypothetical protein
MKIIKSNSYFYELYKSINEQIQLFDYDLKNVKVNMVVTNKSDLNEISFLDENIRYYIEKNYIYSYIFSYTGYETKLYIGSVSQINIPKEGYLMLYLILLLQNVFHKKMKQDIYYYPTPFKKKYSTLSKSKSSSYGLTPREVNSGVTFLEQQHNHSHKNGKIILFRKEEVYKVLVHELIHSFHLDYQLVVHSMRLTKDICSNYPVLLNEVYTECLATMINLYFVYLKNDKRLKSGFRFELPKSIPFIIDLDRLNEMMKLELKYELGLAKKVLELNDLRYNEIWKLVAHVKDESCLKKFAQQTNVFSYYILKPLLLSNMEYYDRFMSQYTKDGMILWEGIQILENYVYNTMKDEKSYFVKLLRKSTIHKTNSLKMVYYQLLGTVLRFSPIGEPPRYGNI